MKSPRIRPKTTSQKDMLAAFESGEAVSGKSKKILDDISKKQDQKQSDVHQSDPIFNSGAVTELVLLAHMQPQSDNPRFLPVKIARSNDEYSLSELTDCVVCEKGILENRLDPNHIRYDDVESEIEEIKKLAEQLKHNDLINPVTVWRGNTSFYPIVSGHRRYYALRYLYGPIIKVKAKIYPKKPSNVNLLRHVENEVRKNLQPGDRLRSFILALEDIQNELNSISSKTEKAERASKLLGMNVAWFYRIQSLTKYKEKALEILDRRIFGGIQSLSDEIRAAFKIGGDDAVNEFLDATMSAGKAVGYGVFKDAQGTQSEEEENKAPKKAGPKKRTVAFPRMKAGDGNAIMRLFKEDVTQLDTGVDWSTLDVNNAEELENAAKAVIKVLIEKSK